MDRLLGQPWTDGALGFASEWAGAFPRRSFLSEDDEERVGSLGCGSSLFVLCFMSVLSLFQAFGGWLTRMHLWKRKPAPELVE